MRECKSNSVSACLRCWIGTVLLFMTAGAVNAQVDYGNRLGQRNDDRRVFSAAGTSVLIDALDPTIQRLRKNYLNTDDVNGNTNARVLPTLRIEKPRGFLLL